MEPTTMNKANLLERIKQLEAVNQMIAHNLRGAGANIKMLSEVLKKKLKRKTKKQKDADELGCEDAFTATEAVEYIHDSSVSFINTLNTLMEATEIKLTEELAYDDCDIEAIEGNVVDQLHGLLKQKNALIHFNLQLKTLQYPKAYMESMLYNFINNALKYSRNDVPVDVTISTFLKDGKPVLTVRDNGIGIDLARYGSKIFNLHQVFHSGYESKGVGLYITRTQIESLGGSISVNSKVGEGSEFVVEL